MKRSEAVKKLAQWLAIEGGADQYVERFEAPAESILEFVEVDLLDRTPDDYPLWDEEDV